MHKKKLGILMLLVFALVLTACGGGGQGSKDTLTVAVSSDATTLDPLESNNIYSENVMKQVYNNLMELDAEGNVVPGLAESVDHEGLDYVVKLREGVKFHNGEALTPEDVVFTLTRLANSPRYGYIYGKINTDSFTVDGNTIAFSLTEPDGSFVQALTHPAAGILNQKAVEEAGDTYGQNPVGTGPFKLESWTPLDNITLTRNDEYWGEAPAFTKMVLRVIPEANNRLIELQSGGVDIAYEIAPQDVSKVEEDENLQVYRKQDNSVHFGGFRVDDGPFANPKAREAMSHALDMNAIVETVYQGMGSVAKGPVNPNFPYSISNEQQAPTYDPQLAQQLFEEAGIEPGTVFKLYTNDNTQRKDMTQIIQSQLRDIGYDAEITVLEWGAYVKALENKEHDMFFMSWTPSIVDPHYALYNPFHSKNMGQGPNYMFYGNDALDVLLDEAVKLDNGDQRQHLYEEAQRIILADRPWLYVANGEALLGANNRVKNLQISATGSHPLYSVTFE